MATTRKGTATAKSMAQAHKNLADRYGRDPIFSEGCPICQRLAKAKEEATKARRGRDNAK